jgi:hypothetical protein
MIPASPASPASFALARRASLSAALALLAPAGQAETSPYALGLSTGIARDSNLLRLADGQAAPEGYRRSDTSRTATLLASLDQPFGRQRASANLSLRDTRYSANSIYDNLGYTAQAGLDWATAERVSGSLTASANRALYSFNIGYDAGLVEQRNLQDTRSFNASVAVGLVTRWSLIANAGRSKTVNSLDEARVQALNFEQEKAGAGLRWRPSSAVVWNLSFDRSRGRYPQYRQLASGEYAADRFEQSSLDFGLTMQPSGASSVALQLGHTTTRYDLNQPRDFSGTTGRLAWNWQPTGKLRLSTRLSRNTGQNSYETTVIGAVGASDYSQVYDTLRLQTDYDFSAKIKLTASWQTVRRTVVNTVESPFVAQVAQGKDLTDDIALGARWAPLRSVLVGCDFNSLKRRTSGSLTTPLHSNGLSCFGQFQMQL